MSLADFFAGRPFSPDPFQVEAAAALERGHTVVVTAPTGAGKTLVAEAAIHLAREAGRRAFYTTPIKALSNQKFGDLVAAYGPADVGLLTGDNVVNGSAPIVVMTTEVLRNMIYADRRSLDDVATVILDEVHYLQDPFRGAVWEEVIIHAPSHVQLVCLSATIANGEEFADWVRERRGATDLIATTKRPVPLENLYMMADRFGPEPLHLLPAFVHQDGRRRPNPRIERLLGAERGGRRRFRTPRRLEVVERLAEDELLPVIYFIFSRAGCDAAALHILESGMRLTTPDQRARARAVAEARTSHLGDEDLTSLGYERWVATLEAGAAAHHAGLIPAFKEVVEELFAAGDLPVVFATETLALGINMPARTVVLESLSKFDGESHKLLEPGDYTQLTGRAGRRGIDVVGYGVVLHSRFVPFDQVVRIAAAGSHPLRSSFRPTYNMAANLVANYPQEEAERLLGASFAQFQRRHARERMHRTLAGLEERLAAELADAACERGSVEEYEAMAGAARAAPAVEELHPGDVIDIPGGPRAGRFVVLKRLARREREPRVVALSTSGKTATLGRREVVAGTQKVGVLDLARPYRARDRRLEQDLLRRLRKIPPTGPAVVSRPHVDHPVAACPDAEAHLGALRRARRTARRIERLRAELDRVGTGLVEEFHRIEALLEAWGYLSGWALTDRGRRLRFVYNELDLLLSECAERGLLSDLTPEELASLVSVFVYEPRREAPAASEPPTGRWAARWEAIESVWQELSTEEAARRLPLTRRPEPGFAPLAFEWASGSTLEELDTAPLAAGDFVRVMRQLVDLLRQLRDAYPELGEGARQALDLVDRGVVAAMGVG